MPNRFDEDGNWKEAFKKTLIEFFFIAAVIFAILSIMSFMGQDI